MIWQIFAPDALLDTTPEGIYASSRDQTRDNLLVLLVCKPVDPCLSLGKEVQKSYYLFFDLQQLDDDTKK